MEDIVSLELIKELFKERGKIISQDKARETLIDLESRIIDFLRSENKIKEKKRNNGFEKIYNQIENDKQFKESHIRFNIQHNLELYRDSGKLALLSVTTMILSNILNLK